MCLLFQGRHDLVETFNIRSANPAANRAFQCGQMLINAVRKLSPFFR
jgi:hypothetical protein